MTTSNPAPLDWRALFRVTRIFGSFRLALSLMIPAALLLTVLYAYGAGLDLVWGLWSDRVSTTAIDDSFAPPTAATAQTRSEQRLLATASLLESTQKSSDSLAWLWADLRQQGVNAQFLTAMETLWSQTRTPQTPQDAATILAKARSEELDSSELRDRADVTVERECEMVLDLVDEKLPHLTTKAAEQIRTLFRQPADYEREMERLEDALDASVSSVRLAVTRRRKAYDDARDRVEGLGVFHAFFNYEVDVLHHVVRQACQLNLLGDVGSIFSANPPPLKPTAGVAVHLMRGLRALVWLLRENSLFAVVFLFGSLVLWALFGGAIHRMAAVRYCTGEKLGLIAALGFSREHIWSYLTAPLTPLLAIAFLAGGVALIGVLGSIPFIGPILAAILFVVVALAGLAATLAFVGLGFGAGLMYPAISVEGTDRFDAVSRSFSYVFAQPWRLALYGVVSLIYGALAYLFVRTIAFFTLLVAHTMLKLGAFGGGGAMGPDADWVDTIYPSPAFWDFHDSNFAATGLGGDIAGAVVSVWVYLAIALVGGFAIAFVVSSTTVIYTMLRNVIDGADFSDVYLESEDESDPLTVSISEELLAKESQDASQTASAETE